MPALLGLPVEHENPRCAFVRTSRGVITDFQPADGKNPGGVAVTTPYCEVANFDSARANFAGAWRHTASRPRRHRLRRARGAADRSLRQHAGVEPGEMVNPPGEGISCGAGVADVRRRCH
ncbi:hypothetical protein [Ideonella sp. A 288]|uniref:hypothetical protein n=1 Tax=Ideonella sp. A 288 TaxID=1962181 RepID=UPI0018FE1D4F|nr:hypothetical protein [Ideonella sp. A 288]